MLNVAVTATATATVSLMLFVSVGRSLASGSGNDRRQPNIIVITADDLGIGDMGYISSNVKATEFIDSMATGKHGTIFTSAFASPYPHGSRVAFHAGRNPAMLGEQHEMVDGTKPFGLSRDVPILSELMKQRGYATHAIGQWDLGFYASNMLPTSRGFDSFYGSYLPYGTYWGHEGIDEAGNEHFDLNSNGVFDYAGRGKFKIELYSSKACDVIKHHDIAKPLYLYVALQSARVRDVSKDCQNIPAVYWHKGEHEMDATRRCFLALVAAIDTAFANIIYALRDRAMLAHSVVLFASMSSGLPAGSHLNGGSNYPLRGQRGTLFEGGMRVPCFLFAPYLGDKALPRHVHYMVDMADWHASLLAFADFKADNAVQRSDSGKVSSLDEQLRGISMLPCLLKQARDNVGCSWRDGILHYLHGNTAAIRSGSFKLITDADEFMSTSTSEWYPHSSSTSPNSIQPVCSQQPKDSRKVLCGGRDRDGTARHCLFDVVADPCEINDLSSTPMYRGIAQVLLKQLHAVNTTILQLGRQAVPVAAASMLEDYRSAMGNDVLGKGWKPWVSGSPHLQRASLPILLSVLLLATSLTSGCPLDHSV